MDHIAVDLGGRESQICVRGSDGAILEERRYPTGMLGQYLATRLESRVVVETCSEALGVADVALEAGHEVRVVPTTLVRSLGVGARRIKTDRGYLIERLLCKDPRTSITTILRSGITTCCRKRCCDGWLNRASHHVRRTRCRPRHSPILRHGRVYRGGHGQIRCAAYGDEVARVHQSALQELSQCW